MGKPTICIGKNKDADQLRGNRKADQRLCFRYKDSTIPLLPKYKISCFQLSSVTVQPGLCPTCSKTTLLVFPRDCSFVFQLKNPISTNMFQQLLNRIKGELAEWQNTVIIEDWKRIAWSQSLLYQTVLDFFLSTFIGRQISTSRVFVLMGLTL